MSYAALTYPFAISPAAATRTLETDDALNDAMRRVLNVVVAFVGIVLTAPLMLLIVILIKLTSRGPAVYTQQRVGLNRRLLRRDDGGEACGRVFTIYKFRTMRSLPANAPQVWATKNDPRITPVGRILRKYRLDELPQLFNVLIGDMNVVGPRPEQPDIVGRLRGRIRNYTWRQRVLPGITGLAQVTLGYDGSIDDVRRKVSLDLEYVRTRSPLQDLRIMARTTLVMLGATGT